jgi:hypothetical protein
MSREELRIKQRQLQVVREKLAKYGMNAPSDLVIEEEDLVNDVRGIQHELGLPLTPTVRERRAAALLPRYRVPEPEPPHVFQERMIGQEQKMRQADIEHQMGLLKIYRRNLAHYRGQMRELGAYAPPYVRNGMQDQVDHIARVKGILRGMGQDVQDLPGDE